MSSTTSEQTWITDANGNRCSIERWGSEAEARKQLKRRVAKDTGVWLRRSA